MNPTLASAVSFALDVAVKSTLVFAAARGAALRASARERGDRHLVGTFGLAAALLVPVLTLALPRVRVRCFPTRARPSGPSRRARRSSRRRRARAWRTRRRPCKRRRRDHGRRRRARSGGRAGRADAAAARARGPERVAAAEPSELSPASPLQAPPWRARRAPCVFPPPASCSARSSRSGRSARSPSRRGWPSAGPASAGWPRLLALHDDGVDRGARRRRATPVARAPGAARRVGGRPVAVTSGWRRPLLLIGHAARSWAVERKRVVLLHELAHVEARRLAGAARRGARGGDVLVPSGRVVAGPPRAPRGRAGVRRPRDLVRHEAVGLRRPPAGHLPLAALPRAPGRARARDRAAAPLRGAPARDPRPGLRARSAFSGVTARLAAAGLFVAAISFSAIEPWKDSCPSGSTSPTPRR
jgi:hypothetical protein